MITIHRHGTPTIAIVIATDRLAREKLCVTGEGVFYFWQRGHVVEVDRDDALNIARMWGADPAVLAEYFGIDDA